MERDHENSSKKSERIHTDFIYEARYTERRKRFIGVAILAPMFLSLLFAVSYKSENLNYLMTLGLSRDYLLLSTIVFGGFSLGFFIIIYLQHGMSLMPAPIKFIFKFMLILSSRLSRFGFLDIYIPDGVDRREGKYSNSQQDVSEEKTSSLESVDIETLKERATEELLEELSAAVVAEKAHSHILKKLDSEFASSKQRLLAEVRALGLRGNVNLTLGVVVTLVGLMLLGNYVWQLPAISNDLVTFLLSFGPRLSLILFIQIFAFFFLKLYKSGLAEIKYFQNEITNLELRYFGLRLSILSSSGDSMALVCKSLMDSERNKFLEKGQSTTDLEKYKYDQSVASGLIKILPGLINKK